MVILHCGPVLEGVHRLWQNILAVVALRGLVRLVICCPGGSLLVLLVLLVLLDPVSLGRLLLDSILAWRHELLPM